MNSARIPALVALVTLVFLISACTPVLSTPLPVGATEAAVTPAPTPSTTQPLLKTKQGDFEIVMTRLVDEVNGVKAENGEKILLLILTQPGLAKLEPSKFSLEDFGNMVHDSNVEIYVSGKDGSPAISTMSGWVGDEFAIGFRVPVGVEPYTLYWTGNSPIVLNIEG